MLPARRTPSTPTSKNKIPQHKLTANRQMLPKHPAADLAGAAPHSKPTAHKEDLAAVVLSPAEALVPPRVAPRVAQTWLPVVVAQPVVARPVGGVAANLKKLNL